MSIVEFLLARIDEQQTGAREWQQHLGAGGPVGATLRGVQEYVGSPAFILAECEAKRRIVAEHAPDGEQCRVCADDEAYTPNGREWTREGKLFPCPTLRALALPYADHPGYDPAWNITKETP